MYELLSFLTHDLSGTWLIWISFMFGLHYQHLCSWCSFYGSFLPLFSLWCTPATPNPSTKPLRAPRNQVSYFSSCFLSTQIIYEKYSDGHKANRHANACYRPLFSISKQHERSLPQARTLKCTRLTAASSQSTTCFSPKSSGSSSRTCEWSGSSFADQCDAFLSDMSAIASLRRSGKGPQKRNALRDLQKRWPNAEVPYQLSPDAGFCEFWSPVLDDVDSNRCELRVNAITDKSNAQISQITRIMSTWEGLD